MKTERCVIARARRKKSQKACRLPVRIVTRMQKQQSQQLAVDPDGSAGDGRKEIQLTAMISIQLPVLGNLACRLVIKVLVRAAGVKKLSVPVPVPRRSARAVVQNQNGAGTNPITGISSDLISVKLD